MRPFIVHLLLNISFEIKGLETIGGYQMKKITTRREKGITLIGLIITIIVLIILVRNEYNNIKRKKWHGKKDKKIN